MSSESQSATEVLVDGKLYDVAKFKHPGGSIIKFFQGSGDATAAISQFHLRSKKYAKMLATLPARDAPAKVIQESSNGKDALAKDFETLVKDLKAEGFFEPNPAEIAYRVSELIALHAVGFLLLLGCSSWAARALGILFLALAEGRCGWLMHEGGHMSLTGNIKLDRTLQIWIYGVGCGMSAGWWRSQHNRHHATPQKLKHDADLETLPLVAFNAACVKGVRSPAIRKWLQAQAYLFMPLTCLLVVLGWQLFLHPRYMVRTSQKMEMVTLLVRYLIVFSFVPVYGASWMTVLGCYLVIQQLAGSYIFTNFALSHTHTDVTQPNEHLHWCEYAALHTTNLSDHWFVNWWMAYLNFQIEHHMFPSMPQFRHPRTAVRVRELFKKHGLPYDVRGYFSCLGDTLRNLHEVGHSIEMPAAESQKSQRKEQ